MGFHLVVINSPNELAAFKERSMPVGANAGGFSFTTTRRAKARRRLAAAGPDADLDALQEINWRREEGSGR